ncbi:inactive beta-amylase 9-like [Miscanthus floridulus]|uniref:inactive beta-amylase 9-like n=1 Tax=Miscanthus floridulus TaxID=154761 RepID=UPI0034585AE1
MAQKAIALRTAGSPKNASRPKSAARRGEPVATNAARARDSAPPSHTLHHVPLPRRRVSDARHAPHSVPQRVFSFRKLEFGVFFFSPIFNAPCTGANIRCDRYGELQYPSYPPGNQGSHGYAGIGEFQCYDKYMLARLKRHAESSGQPLWGLSGPHDGPRYDESPESSAFFREPGGSWRSAYGEFFLSWYAGELLAHGDRVLAAASRAFGGKPVALSAKVPLLRGSSPVDATAGLHGGYGPVAEMFVRHGCAVIASGVEARPDATAEESLARIKVACAEYGARLAAESAPLAVARDGAGSGGGVWLSAGRTRPFQFTYQRMGAEFFSPAHWPLFVRFVRALECPEEAREDDLPASADGGERLTVPSASASAAAPLGEAAREAQTV